LQEVVKRVTEAYEQFQFHVVYMTLYNFCTVDLSSLYLDVLKDRLYTSAPASAQRRSAQTAMFAVLDAMTRLLAPILTFTAEEIWSAMPGGAGKATSIHMASFPKVDPACLNPELGERWRSMITLKAEIAKAVELARKNKVIGHSLDARVEVAPPDGLRELLEGHREDMRSLLIVSQFEVVGKEALTNAYESPEIKGLWIGVGKARGSKCGRCWIYHESLGGDDAHPTLCARCLKQIA
jgi:isoleucyl-tRNA synthetase